MPYCGEWETMQDKEEARFNNMEFAGIVGGLMKQGGVWGRPTSTALTRNSTQYAISAEAAYLMRWLPWGNISRVEKDNLIKFLEGLEQRAPWGAEQNGGVDPSAENGDG